MTDVARIGGAAGSGSAGLPGVATGAPASLVSEVSGLAQLVTSLEHDGRSGWKTTEFWASITTWLLPILTLIWHRDLTSLAVPLAVVAAAAAQAVYTISRAITKKGHAAAIASMAAASPALLAAAPPPAALPPVPPAASAPVPAAAPASVPAAVPPAASAAAPPPAAVAGPASAPVAGSAIPPPSAPASSGVGGQP